MSQNPYDPYGAAPGDPYSSASGRSPYTQPPSIDPYAGDPRNAQQYPQQPYAQPPFPQTSQMQSYGRQTQPYGAPAPQGYGYAPPVPADGGAGNVAPNLWLSVFFGWIPALIYYLTCKDRCAPTVRKAHADNLSFQLLRLIVSLVPYLGWLAALVLFVIAIVNAAQVPGQVRNGQQARFTLTPNWIR